MIGKKEEDEEYLMSSSKRNELDARSKDSLLTKSLIWATTCAGGIMREWPISAERKKGNGRGPD